MVDNPTTNYGWIMPGDHVNTNTWGAIINSDLQAIDAQVWAVANPSTITITKFTPSTPGLLQFNNGSATAGQQFRWAVGMYADSESGGNAGSDLEFNRYADNGAFLGTALTLGRANGSATFAGPIIANGAVTFAGPITANGALTINGATTFSTSIAVHGQLGVTPGDNSIIATAGGSYVTLCGSPAFANGSAFIVNGGGRPTYSFEWYYANVQRAALDGVGSLYLNGPTGQKISGTVWSNPSDARIKNITGGYTAGLTEVLRLNPVSFTFKDNYTREAGGASPYAQAARDRTLHAGFVAQEIEAIFPEMVTKSEAYIDGRKVSDFRSLDTSNVILALVNAVKTLAAEIEELKAARQ